MNKKLCIVNNIYPFNSFSSIVVRAQIDNYSYKEVVEKQNNVFLKFCKNLAHFNTFKERLNILKDIFEGEKGVIEIILINEECNVLFVYTSLLKDVQSINEYIHCQNLKYPSIQYVTSTIIMKLSNRFGNLENNLIT